MEAAIVRLSHWKADLKIVTPEGGMHVLQWRRFLFRDEVRLDGKRQHVSRGLFNRETIYGLVFGRDDDGKGGTRVMLVIDARADMNSAGYWTDGASEPRGVRLETAEGSLLSYGSLDERQYDKPADFKEWAKKTLGMTW